MIGIYMIISPSNKIYIGQSINIEKRFLTYKRYDCKNQVKLYNSLIKYGFNNHEFKILSECLISELNINERYYQDLYSSLGINGLNCKLTKTNDKSGKLSDNTKTNISLGNKGKVRSFETKLKLKNINLGRKHSDETKRKISSSNIGRKSVMLNKSHSEKSKKLMSDNNCKYWLGKKRDEATKEKISKSLFGKTISQEAKNKISKNNPKIWLGKKFSEEHKLKLSLKKVNKQSNCARIIIDISNGIFYNSIREASLLYGIKESTLNMQLKGTNKNKTNLRYA